VVVAVVARMEVVEPQGGVLGADLVPSSADAAVVVCSLLLAMPGTVHNRLCMLG
jgi:hypothetical protein